MRSLIRLFLILCLLFAAQNIEAQSPPFFSYNTENGAPSNEMYWVHQDRDGYIWIGCDAGLYRFNGVRYERFTSSELTARSATGIIQSKTSGRIYAYNFNKQIFYIENEQLKVIKGWKGSVNGLADDGKGNIWITSGSGLFIYKEQSEKLIPATSENLISSSSGNVFTSHGITTVDDAIYFQHGNKVFRIKNGRKSIFQLGEKVKGTTLLLSRFSLHPWIFSLTGEDIYTYSEGEYQLYINKQLKTVLSGKKLNCVFEASDGKLWIGTYTGLICHDPLMKKTELFYPEFSFSYGTEDREGNYWLTTLHHGSIRIPNVDSRSWRSLDQKGIIEQFSHICTNGKEVFLGGANGSISTLKNGSSDLLKYSHLPLSDLGTIYWDPIDQCIYFNKLNKLYRFKEGRFALISNETTAIKSMLHTDEGYFMLSSQGLFFSKSITEPLTERNMIQRDWSRDIVSSPFSSSFYVAGNNGIIELTKKGNTYQIKRKYLEGKQVVSVSADLVHNKIYLYSFDGVLYCIDKQKRIKKIRQWEGDIRIVQIRWHNNRIFMASNKGILVFDPSTDRSVLFNRYNGLSSNNIRSISFSGSYCWAIGESLQKIPLSAFGKSFSPSKIHARQVLVNEKAVRQDEIIELSYKDKLTLIADGICYRSNGTFQFAYRIGETNNNWITVPGSSGKIDFASLPNGNLIIELKLIDHEGKDSVNTIRYNLYVKPPFWQRWWFYVMIALLVAASAFLIFRNRISILRKKQQLALQQLQLENELRLTQQSALKAQMNPHFLFNVLNSIKGYIYENDKKNAARYLSDFSSLVRKVLELSSLSTVALEQELEALKIYIDLEAMLLQSDFAYEIHLDPNVDTSAIQVPALLLQPYVENAFKHGLRHKPGKKRLLISVRMIQQKGLLIVEITDNGIGRKASMELNAQYRNEHQSFATSAMEKRIELLNYERRDVVGVELRDNFEGAHATGTTVIIQIHV